MFFNIVNYYEYSQVYLLYQLWNSFSQVLMSIIGDYDWGLSFYFWVYVVILFVFVFIGVVCFYWILMMSFKVSRILFEQITFVVLRILL